MASPELIYIDLKDWVGLSKARIGQEAGAYTEALAELRAAVASGHAVVPISSTHYMEISRIAAAQRRANLALVMGEVSRYVALTSREVFLRHEFRRSLALELGVNYAAQPPPVTGFGFEHAFGGQANLRLRGGSAAELESFAAEHGTEFIRSVEKQTGYGWRFVASGAARTPLELVNEALDATAQFRMLMGPADKQDPDLLKRGFNPAAAYEVVDRITQREADLAAHLAAEPHWRQRLDDIIEARALLWDLNELWYDAVTDVWPRLVTIEEFGMERLHRILRGIPIIDIESSIRRANFSTGSHKWKKNDIHDSDFAGSAVTYCTVVLTERHLRTQLVRQGIDRKYGTTIFSRPEDLVAHLRQAEKEPAS